VFCGIVLIVAIVLLAMQRKFELPFLLLIPMCTIPIFLKSYEFCLFGRYLGFLIPIVCLTAAFLVAQSFDYFWPKRKAVAITLLFTAVALYTGWHLRELSRTYEVFRNENNTDIFSAARGFLKNYDRRNTFVLVDYHSWQGQFLTVYLQTDGWHVEALAG